MDYNSLHQLRMSEATEYLKEQNVIEIKRHESNLSNKIILGDSQLYDLQITDFNNCCIKGDNISNANYRLKRYLKLQAVDEIIICLGTNDIDQLYSIDEIIDNYKVLVNCLASDVKIIILPIFNINPTFDNEFMRSRTNEFIDKLNVKLISTFDNLVLDVKNKFNDKDGKLAHKYTYDGLHLNDEGLNIIYDELKKSLL